MRPFSLRQVINIQNVLKKSHDIHRAKKRLKVRGWTVSPRYFSGEAGMGPNYPYAANFCNENC